MTQQLLPETPEKTQQHVEGRETGPDSAPSFQGGLHPIAQLQRTLGNRNVAKLIQAKQLTPGGKIIGLQRKLTVGAADDQYEQEADRVARQVMNTPDAVAVNSMQRAMSPEEDKDKMLQTKSLAASITPFAQRQIVNNEESEDKEKPVQAKFLTGTSRKPLQRQPDTEDEKKEPIQTKSAGSMSDSFEAGANVETQVSQSKGRGSPLPDPVRAYMEPRFGVDFSHVHVHTGSEALLMNQAVGAQAFTHGSDIYFGEGRSPTNLELTAHELTHVVQQTGGAPLQTKKQEQPVATPVLRYLSNGVVLRAPKASTPCPMCAANQEEMVQRQAHQEGGAPSERGKRPLNFLSTNRAVAEMVKPLQHSAIQRDDKDKDKDKPKYKGPNPDTPFDLLPKVIGGVEDLAIAELKSLTGDAIEHAYGEYKSAIELVTKQLGLQKEAEEEAKKKQLDFVLSAALSFVPVAEIGEAIAGPILLKTLQTKVNTHMDSLVAKAVTQQAKQEAFVLSREAKSALTDDALKSLADKFSAEKATEAVKKAGEAASGEGTKMILSGNHPYDLAASFLEAMRETASLSVPKLQVRKSLLNDLSQIIGVYQAFTGATVNYFRPALTDRAHNFIRQISGMLDVTKDETVVWINAYGARRLANVQRFPKDTYAFGSWITPDMEPLALKLQPNPKEVSTAQIKTHIPDPLTEIPANHDRLVRINAWGRPRLAIVKGESSWNPLKDTNRTAMTFVRWVAPDEENAQLARESGQIGGIPNIDPANIEGLKAPD